MKTLGPLRRRSFSRADRVSEVLHRHLAMYLLEDRVKDERLNNVQLTITHVKVSDDLKHVKVFLQALGQNSFSKEWTAALNEQKYRIKREVARELSLRHTPEIEFLEDVAFRQGENLLNLIESVSHHEENGNA